MVFLVGEKELRSGKPSVWARNALRFLSWRHRLLGSLKKEVGVEDAIFAIEQDTKDFMLEVLQGDVAVFSSGEDDTVSDHLGSLTSSSPSSEYTISEEAFEEILDIAKRSMMVSVPVYSVEGDVIGEYSFVRF